MPFPDAAIARYIRPAHELTMFAPIRRDMALCHGEWRNTLTTEPCTVTLSWVTPSIQAHLPIRAGSGPLPRRIR
jgi:hypothetical protein